MEIIMTGTEDRRIRKTKKAMADALAQLLLQKPLSSISVREISELADINRGTFYLHYRDVYDLAETLQNEIFEKFQEVIDNYEPEETPDNLFPVLAAFYTLLSENATLAQVLLGKNGDAAFIDKLKNVLREKCFSNAQKVLKVQNNEEFNYFYHFIVSGCTGIVSAWLAGGMKETPAGMAHYTEAFILNGARTFE